MRRTVIAVWAVVLALVGAAAPGHAEKRVALVVGNDLYGNLLADQQLRRAANDARAVGDALGRLGFEVLRGENLGRQALVEKFDELTRRLSPGDTAFFFFAGHGVSIGRDNYILPTDVPNVQSGQETLLARASLGENDIVSDLQGRGVRVAVVVLDACRNNPFTRSGTPAIGGVRGLVRSDPVQGVFSIYSAGIGQTALDRLGDADINPNSVFTRVLVPALGRPGLDLGGLAVEVREEVARLAGTIGHIQRPAYYDETTGGRIYLAGLPLAGAPPAADSSQAEREAERAWAVINDTTRIAALEEFVRRYGDSHYAALARVRMEALRKSQAAAPSDDMGKFVSQILGSADVQWKQIFEQAGQRYRAPTLVLFTGATRADACGQAQSAMGPFYCPPDNKIYLDTSFFHEIERRLNGCDAGSSSCKFAQAYVIVHQISHHVQNQLGILSKVQQLQRGLSKTEANHLQVRVELQADCFAGIWAARADKQWQLIQPGDVEAAMRTAAAIGDDHLQKQAQGYVVPDSFTHGSSEQRQRWFQIGLKSGTVGACNTFAANAQL